MTVFKGFMTLVKRNIFTFFLYLAIFMTICIMIQVLISGEGTVKFEEESLEIAVIDRDGGELARGLASYLGGKHHLTDIADDKKTIQENLFYRNIYYVVTIPENFEEKCLEGEEKLKTTKIPGASTAFYVDQQIDTFLNDVRVLKAAGFSTEEAIAEVGRIGEISTDVTLIDKNGHGGQMAPHAFLFQYLPYMILSVLCYIIGFVMVAYRKKDVRRRMLCSAVSLRSQNVQLVAAYLVIGAVLWIICMCMPLALYGKEFLQDGNLIYYLLNSFVLTLVSLAISFLIGVLVEKEEVINGVVNVISLGMSFTCGVFVSMSVLGKGVRAFAHFLPVYWYEIVNEIIGSNAEFTVAQKTTIFQGIGIQLLFAAAILSAGLAVSKYKEQE
ncbi:ABC transporter permease [Dorea acetigenes]|jgi:ABC-2 type transport system permease protein|uniref:ABC transporter permease n=1 Tax=Dorea acetigenes TaxID=2981787 RepID=A0ABT2RM84_9FIRM|nr:ABC transporter permease [Dorea acetigenes]MCU6686527.1 ABC transporter permease [Dorea acetigenes]SCI98805.1 ABC-2 family transporter protein [uncultured Clostridium sp.]